MLSCQNSFTHLTCVIDHSLPHIDDAVSANVGDSAPVEATHHPLLPLDGQVGINHTLTRELNIEYAFLLFIFEGTYFVLLLSSSHLHSHLED